LVRILELEIGRLLAVLNHDQDAFLLSLFPMHVKIMPRFAPGREGLAMQGRGGASVGGF
jgi:hypothetical protein